MVHHLIQVKETLSPSGLVWTGRVFLHWPSGSLLYSIQGMSSVSNSGNQIIPKLIIDLQKLLRTLVRNENSIFLFFNQTYVVGTQKNRLNETVLLSIQNIS